MTNGHGTTPVEELSDPYAIGQRIAHRVIESAPRGDGLPEENRGSWFCPCAEPRHEALIRHLLTYHDLTTVYDLGAGDLRLATSLSGDYNVIAYETNEYLAETAYEMHGEPDIDVRVEDYYGDWDTISTDDAVFACIGKTNKLPDRPEHGIGVQGADDITIVRGTAQTDSTVSNGVITS